MNQVCVRYAPSPTGHLHVGSLRTALYNWLFARHHGGTFLIRIEDTDRERSEERYTTSILETLAWADMMPDEAVVMQSERIASHMSVAEELLKQGKAYRCFCTVEELHARLGETAAQEGSYTRYDEKCRSFTDADLNLPYAIRFKMPADREYIEFNDLIRGPIRFERDQVDDFIIVRSDGTPMYNFVVVVDDAFMRITHVLRGEDHISNTPKQILLYEACGYSLPQFAHFSLILGADGHRLSKRHGDVSVVEFKKEGFLAPALINYLVRLGWSHGDQEIFTREELIQYFSLEHMSKAGAIFDHKKLEWMNGIYIRSMTSQEIVDTIERDIDPAWSKDFVNWSSATLNAMIALYQDRVKTLKELMHVLLNLHERPDEFPEDISTYAQQTTLDHLTAVEELLRKQDDFSAEAVNHAIKELCRTLEIRLPQVAQPIRIALTGQSSSPGIAQLIAILGREESTQRTRYFMEYLKRRVKH